MLERERRAGPGSTKKTAPPRAGMQAAAEARIQGHLPRQRNGKRSRCHPAPAGTALRGAGGHDSTLRPPGCSPLVTKRRRKLPAAPLLSSSPPHWAAGPASLTSSPAGRRHSFSSPQSPRWISAAPEHRRPRHQLLPREGQLGGPASRGAEPFQGP